MQLLGRSGNRDRYIADVLAHPLFEQGFIGHPDVLETRGLVIVGRAFQPCAGMVDLVHRPLVASGRMAAACFRSARPHLRRAVVIEQTRFPACISTWALARRSAQVEM